MSIRRSGFYLLLAAITVGFLRSAGPGPGTARAQTNQSSVLSVNAAGYGGSIWTPTGLTVQQGDIIVFQADTSSTWCSGGVYNGGASCGGPDGIRPPSSSEHPTTLIDTPAPSIGLLIGRIGQYPPFAVGGTSYTDPILGTPSGEVYAIAAAHSGELDLAMNDVQGRYGDNSGAIGISVIDDGTFSTCSGTALQSLHLCSFTPLQLPPSPP